MPPFLLENTMIDDPEIDAFMLGVQATRPVAIDVKVPDDILRRIGEVRAVWSPLALAELDRFDREE
jgi:hypothetical protein